MAIESKTKVDNRRYVHMQTVHISSKLVLHHDTDELSDIQRSKNYGM